MTVVYDPPSFTIQIQTTNPPEKFVQSFLLETLSVIRFPPYSFVLFLRILNFGSYMLAGLIIPLSLYSSERPRDQGRR
ncbi:uncharacterized protein LAESUDRAFT_205662 [Laetiporus sulphureus 93-53]|uniref:Uncharacterized protein n=1 Tax=Laetiporus sulphureus 93-53 TaxID=1314785 RepID=A0A165DYX7_9APHY|nr:uncharacterized protein LAESUDRAFT_205662 [Laetiporus sulphureus 93-53]KZT05915.1 hypothetical protein LAESUDRAFT_205662 [Laetiporus sulphureus 93-53]